MAAGNDGENRILTLPNAISLGRLACVPLFVWLLFGLHRRLASAVLLGGLGATDWVDGWIARRWNQVSTLGKVLDPVADRILLGVAVVAILVDGAVPAWLAVMVIVREGVVSLAALALAALGAKRIDVQWVGKTGTLLLMFAFPLFLAGHVRTWGPHDVVRVLAWACGIAGLAFSWYSAATYVPIATAALRDGRSTRSEVQA